jgi:hypothetical protein
MRSQAAHTAVFKSKICCASSLRSLAAQGISPAFCFSWYFSLSVIIYAFKILAGF